jgi:MoaA/NifB/PqqE/SkfB family radical SAM enzyme
MKKAHKITLADGSVGLVVNDDKKISLLNENYNFVFHKKDGFFARWGKTMEDDGDLELGLPEIADIEIAEVCEGVPGIGPCAFCYKSNTGFKGTNMSLETFKKVFDKLPPTVTQIAFGCGTLRKHPEMWDIFKYAKDNDVVPNLTINGDVDDHEFDKIADMCGACAVSIYDKDLSYDAIKKLTDRGMTQVNIHYMISEETYDKAFEIMDDIKSDPRLKKLNALVFLSLKPKGRSYGRFNQLNQEKFSDLVQYALDNQIPFGFDSCSAQKVMKYIDTQNGKLDGLKAHVEPCESTLYSLYIDVRGNFYPCSFSEGIEGWEEGLSVLDCNNFLEDIWFNEKTKLFLDNVIQCRGCGQSCTIYEI